MVYWYLWTCMQIILESFPVSSSGHVRLLSFLYPLHTIGSQHIIETFTHILHFPTACILMIFFRKSWSKPVRYIKRYYSILVRITCYTMLSCVVTAMGYGIKQHVNIADIPLCVGFFITMAALLSLYVMPQRAIGTLNAKKAVVLGVVQACALFPGVSRFALTFVAARWLDITPRRAFEISFLIEWPLILAASVYGLYVLQQSQAELLNPTQMYVMLCSSGPAYAGLLLQYRMVRKQVMWRWGIYMVVPLFITLLVGVVRV